MASAPNSSWTDDGAPANEPSPVSGFDLAVDRCYRWQLAVSDGAGNEATATSGVIAVSRVKLDYPAPGWALFSTEALRATALPSANPTRIDFLVDGVVAGSTSEDPYGVTLDTTTIADGAHTIAVTLVSDAGSWTSPAIPVSVANALSPLDRVDTDYASERIDLSDMVLLGTYAVGAPALNPTRYSSATPNEQDVFSPDPAGASADVIATVTEFQSQPLRGGVYVSWVSDPRFSYNAASQPQQAPENCTTDSPSGPEFLDQDWGQAWARVRFYADLSEMANGHICQLTIPGFKIYYADRGRAGSLLDYGHDVLGFTYGQNGFELTHEPGGGGTPAGNGLPDLVDVYAVQLSQARAYYHQPMIDGDQPRPHEGPSLGGLGFDVPAGDTHVSLSEERGHRYIDPLDSKVVLPTIDKYGWFSVAAHEMFHVVQGQYTTWADRGDPWSEATAEWATSRFKQRYPSYQDPAGSGWWPSLTQQLEPWSNVFGYWADPSGSATGMSSSSGYERMVFPEFVTEHYRGDFVLTSYTDHATFQNTRAAVLHNTWMPQAFSDFAVANYLLAAVRANPQRTDVADTYKYTHPDAYGPDATGTQQRPIAQVASYQDPFSYIKRQKPTNWQSGHLSGKVSPDGLGVAYVELNVPPDGSGVVPTLQMRLRFVESSPFARYQVTVVSDNYPKVCAVQPTLDADDFTYTGPGTQFQASASVLVSPDCPRVTLVVTHLETLGELTWSADLTGSITGLVTDGPNGAPIVGATVSSGTATATTDTQGLYSLPVQAGGMDVTASATGHIDETVIVTAVTGQEVTQDFALERVAPGLWFRGLTPFVGATYNGSDFEMPPTAVSMNAQQVAAGPTGALKVVGGVYMSPDGSHTGYLDTRSYSYPTYLPGTTSIGSVGVVAGQVWNPYTYTMDDWDIVTVFASGTDGTGQYVAAFDYVGQWSAPRVTMPEVWRRYPVPGGRSGTGPALSAPAGTEALYFATDTSDGGIFVARVDSGGVQSFPVPSSAHVGKIISSADGSELYVSIRDQASGEWSIRRYNSNGTVDSGFAWTGPEVTDFALDPSDGSLYVTSTQASAQLCKYTNAQQDWCRSLPDVTGYSASAWRASGASNGHVYLANLTTSQRSGETVSLISVTIVDGADGYAIKTLYSGSGVPPESSFVDTSVDIADMAVANDEVYIVGTTNPEAFGLQWLWDQFWSGEHFLSLLAVKPYGYGAWFTDIGEG